MYFNVPVDHTHRGSHENGPNDQQANTLALVEHAGLEKPAQSGGPDQYPCDTVIGALNLFHAIGNSRSRQVGSISCCE